MARPRREPVSEGAHIADGRTCITYIRTCEGFAYLAVVIDLYSRRVFGRAMQSRQTTDVVSKALLMAVGNRKPKDKVLVHSDQGTQFTSMDWASFLKHRNLVHSMSRRGNCHDNAVAEGFFNLLEAKIRCDSVVHNDEPAFGVFDKQIIRSIIDQLSYEKRFFVLHEQRMRLSGCAKPCSLRRVVMYDVPVLWSIPCINRFSPNHEMISAPAR
jgi:transposase InsO family protein